MSYLINEILSDIDANRADIQKIKSALGVPNESIGSENFDHPDFEVCYSSSASLPIGTPVILSSIDAGDTISIVVKASTNDSDGLCIGVVVKPLNNGSVVIKKNGRVVGIIDENGTTGKDGSSEVPTDHYAVGQKVYVTDNDDDDTNFGVVVPDDADLISFTDKYVLGNVCKTIRISNPSFGDDPGESEYNSYVIFDWNTQLMANDSAVGQIYDIDSGPGGSGFYGGDSVDADGAVITAGLTAIRPIGLGAPTVPGTYPGGMDYNNIRWFFFNQAVAAAQIEGFSGNAVIYDTTPPAASDPYINGGIVFNDDSRVYFKLDSSITIESGDTNRISVSIGNAVYFALAGAAAGQIRIRFVKETFDIGTITWANQPTSFTGYSLIVSGDVAGEDGSELVLAIGPVSMMQDLSTAMTIYGVMIDCTAPTVAHCAINQHQIDSSGGSPGNPTEEAYSPNAVSIILP